jgi:hypothetical protein
LHVPLEPTNINMHGIESVIAGPIREQFDADGLTGAAGVADTPEEALALARAAHPEDDGSFIRYIPKEKLARIARLAASRA